jgi:hypothetical protein
MTDRRYTYATAALFGVLLVAEPAFAQIAGGGGQGLLSQVIQWFVTNIVNGLIAAAVLFVGCSYSDVIRWLASQSSSSAHW